MCYMLCKTFTFEAAHQLLESFSRECSDSIHGHSYTVRITVRAVQLDADDMVIDFGRLKPIITKIKEEWDHALLLGPALHEAYQKDSEFSRHSHKVVLLDMEPTAEVMARILLTRITRDLDDLYPEYMSAGRRTRKLCVYSVSVQETATGWAECVA